MRPPTACCTAASRAAALRLAPCPALRPRATMPPPPAAAAPTPSRRLSHLQRPATTPAHPSPSPSPSRSRSHHHHHHRAYHSYDHPPPPGPFGAAEAAILSAAYAHVPSRGFGAEALALGARDAGYLDVSPAIVPDGAFGLVRWHLVSRRDALAARAADIFAPAEARALLSTAERAEALAWERLLGNREVVGRLQEALAIMAQPSYVPASLKELAMLADEIWFLAGDVAVDPSWYTKRASLSAIYTASELFMTNDQSPDFQDTREFLRRRFSEANDLGGAVKSIGQWLGFTASAGINVLRSKGMPV